LGAFLLTAGASAAPEIPSRPYLYVLDEPKVLSAQARQALETLLIEHDKATGERVMVAVLHTLKGEQPKTFATEVYREWKIGRFPKGNGVLLALFWREREAWIQPGFAIEGLLPESRTRTIIADHLLGGMNAAEEDSGRALISTTLHVLSALESPLITNGKADEIFRNAGFRGSWSVSTQPGASAAGWALWLVLGLALSLVVLSRFSAAEAHFTSEGWKQPRLGLIETIKSLYSKLEKATARHHRTEQEFTGGGTIGNW
jgi:uncharacterized membrane protein YgcG